MSGKTILAIACPLTQEAAAVKQLIKFVTGKTCKELPATFALAKGVQLTKSKKGEVFYVTTPTACSCPARTYHPGQACKHMKALLARNSRAQARAYQARQRELRGKSGAVESIRPGKDEGWAGGLNGPVEVI